ncbi:mechanosensitive ion channel family protein [Rhizobium sp. LC145]|uniref:mechanosensitive ion channel family protein n=1 Tax=Rhizobium sp. LC145 TaxID=1120688 RepID=UPI00069B34C7|nr:mechanosensitive ion channel family protein [Rhizobium sp. LC145]
MADTSTTHLGARRASRVLIAALCGALLTAQLAVPFSAAAQQPAATEATQPAAADVTVDSINDQMRGKLQAIRDRLTSFREKVQEDAQDDARLAELRLEAEEIVGEMRSTSESLNTRVQQIQARLTDLGEPPQQGQPPEPPLVTEERNRLLNERVQINTIVDDATNLSSSATQLANTITNLRRTLFTQTLFRHTELTPELFTEAGQAFVHEVGNFWNTLGSWVSFAWRYKTLQLLGAIVLSFGAALLFLVGGYRLFGRFIRRENGLDKPSYIKRLSVAFWSTVIQNISLTAFLVASFLFLDGFNVLRPDIAPIIAAFAGLIWFVGFVWRLTYAVLSPGDPDWRLVRLTNSGARLLSWAVLGMAAVNGLDYLLGTISEALNSPLVLTIVKSLIASIVIGLILIAISFLKPVLEEGNDPDAPGAPWPRLITILLRLMGLLLIFAVITGYVGFARFASTQIVLTGAVLVTIYIGILSGKAVAKQGAFAHTVVGTRLAERFRFGEVALDQAGLAAGLGIYAFALIFGIPLILFTWGFQLADIESWVYRFFTGFRIGNISISLIGIFGGILVFGVGYILTRWVQNWIDGNIMARSQVDAGVRNSVKTGIGYLGVGMAVLVGVSAAGIDLSSFALVASALSVGIGFGLQNVVSNFVSGLILLVERPFKVGDHVVTGTTEGIVKRISVRATEIETFRKQSIIVPNSDLINAAVGNWTHRNRIQRSEIPVSVSYGTDPQTVIDILLELVNEVPEVLRIPEPHVEFTRFGASSLDFELRFHLPDIGEGLRIRNDLRIAILQRFQKEGIEIPFPQQEIVFHRGKPMVSEHPEDDGRGGA